MQVGAVRNFVETPSADTTLLNLKWSDTITFKAGFKYYPRNTQQASAWSDASATAINIGEVNAAELTYVLSDTTDSGAVRGLAISAASIVGATLAYAWTF